MEVGTHLPQVATGTDRPDAGRVRDVVDAARELGLAAVCANDHLAFHRPWLDGPTLLAAIADRGSAAALEYAELVESPATRGAVLISIWFDPADDGKLRRRASYERTPA